MTYPVNNPTTYSKNYGTEGPENDPDYPEGEDWGMDEEPGEGFDDEFVDGTENQYSGPVTRKAEIKRVQGLIEICDDPITKGLLRDILLTLKQLVFLKSEEEQAAKLAKLDTSITKFEGDIYTTIQEEEAAKGGLQGQIDEIKERAKESLDKGLIIQDTYNLIDEGLVKAQAIVDLKDASEGQIEEAELFILNANELLAATSTQPVSAQKLAQELNKPIEDIVAAAEDAGVDLDNLKVDEKLMEMFDALGIPNTAKIEDYTRIKGERENDMIDLKATINAKNEEWRADTSNYIPYNLYYQSWAYWDKTDSEYQQMASIVGELQGEVINALNALGLNATAGGATDKIMISGTTSYDFFTEDSQKLTFSTTETTLTQKGNKFAPAYNNTEADTSNFPDGEDNWYHNHDPAGYPEESYTVD